MDFSCGPVVNNLPCNPRDTISSLVEELRSYMPGSSVLQLLKPVYSGAPTPQLDSPFIATKIPCDAIENQHSQINE